MKKLLLFICVINLTAAAQDSTSISFGTETVNEFRKQNLMDEYERAFGTDRKVNTRFKIGFTDFPNSKYSPILPFISLEHRFKKNLSLTLSGIISTRENYFPQIGQFINRPEDIKVSIDAELRYYLKSNQSLSGNYIGLEFKKSRTPLHLSHGLSPFLTKPYYLKSQLSVNAGKQFGSVLDMGLQLGLKNVLKPELDKSGFVNISKDYKGSLTPFIGLYSKISLGIDFPLTKGLQNSTCEFLNCFTEFDHLLKANLSNSFYLDPYFQNIKLDLAYEQKLGKLPVSLNLDAVSNLNNERNYKPVKREVNPDNQQPLPSYESRRINQTFFTFNSTLQMRYYFLQTNSIAKGKAVKNLSGIYGGLFYTRFLKIEDQLKFIRISYGGESFTSPRYSSGFILGLQRKILKNYYYDFSIKYNATFQNTLVYMRFNQDIKFGYAF